MLAHRNGIARRDSVLACDHRGRMAGLRPTHLSLRASRCSMLVSYL